ncbi:MAG: nucleotidyl transferase AbiEii/AbiGii toxin family protein [Candidatus Andersenbacteria bacterium]|nr:nucleotidyl transferase AbiEii/AbiGii toxin family protein [bacterium]MDZ4225518.1 nucleotidyl transferase AbiEii/AbiGii toxin family protein [Candidatus Andersenbacteria bacterium]
MSLDIAIHRSVLIKILKDIYTDSSLGPSLGFKGGTAVYLFYNLNRFSVDLDFDLLTVDEEGYVFERVKKILKKYGLVKDAVKKRYNLFFMMAYDDKVPGAQNIKVEINRRDFGSKYESKSYLGIPVKVMVREDMAAHKLVAMLERIGRTNRDIYDVFFFLQNDWPINKSIVEARTGLGWNEYLKKVIDKLEKLANRNILAGMGELLDEKQKAWVKENLKREVVFLLKLKLEKE